MPHTTPPDMGDAPQAPHAEFDDIDTDNHDDTDTGHACDCSQANSDELHHLVAALAAAHGIDVCNRSIDEEHDIDDPDEDGDVDGDASDLQLIHDVLVAQGAHCSPDGEDEDGMDDEEGEPGDEEFELHSFSDDDDADDLDEFDDDNPATFSVSEIDATATATPLDPDILHGLATFDLGPPIDEGDYVRYKNARIFKAGDYPRKAFSLPIDEMRAAVARIDRPIPLELEHINSAGTATFIDGEYGVLENPRVEGEWTVGDVVLDKWVNRKWDKFLEKTGETAKQISAVWNRATRDMERVGLVIKGHVEGAALNAAFSDKDDDSAIDAMFDDAPDDEGQTDDPATFATPRKRDRKLTHVWQRMHDQSAMVPGICPANPIAPTGSSPAMMGDIPQQFKHLKATHDHALEHGATCPGKAMMSHTLPGNTDMPKIDAEAIESPEATDDEMTEFVHEHPDVLALKAELAAIRAERDAAAAKFAEESEKARVKSVDDAARAFANDEIKSGRSTSAEFTDLVLSYTDAAHLDHRSGEVVTFADAAGAKATGSRVDALKAREAKRPSHSLFSPALGDKELVHDGETILFNSKANDDESSVRAKADAVLATTNEGRNILAKRKKAAK